MTLACLRAPAVIARALLHLWRCGDTRVATVASILSGYLWGVSLAWPGDTMSRPTYRLMAQIASEPVWAAVFLALATLQSYRLWAQLTRRAAPLDHAIKFVAMLLWSLVAVLCFAAQYPPAAAMSDTVVIALATWWDFMRHEQAPSRSYYTAMRGQGGAL